MKLADFLDRVRRRRTEMWRAPKNQMGAALGATGKHVYAGTVHSHVKAARRRKNKAARIARRVHRR